MRSTHLIISAFLSLKIIVDTLTDVGNAKQISLIKNKHITLISDANGPVRFRAQQRAKYSLLLLKANCIAAQTDLRITEHKGHKFSPSHYRSFPFKTRIDWPPDWPQSQVFRAYFSTLAIFKATSKFFGPLGCSDDKNWLELSSNFFRICSFRSSILVSLQVFIPREATLKSSLTVAWFS